MVRSDRNELRHGERELVVWTRRVQAVTLAILDQCDDDNWPILLHAAGKELKKRGKRKKRKQISGTIESDSLNQKLSYVTCL